MKLTLCLLIGSLAALLLAYWLYEPVPDYVKDRKQEIISTAMIKIFIALGRGLEYLRLGSVQGMLQGMTRFSDALPANSSSVTFAYRMFANSKTVVASPAAAAQPAGGVGGRGGRPALIYIHGGGWVLGSPETYAQMFGEMVEKTGLVVIGVRYRFAPEHKFPAAFDDCLAATEAIFASAAAVGIDPSRIAIAGDSAGGQLTASVVQQLHRSGSQFKPKLQLLIYPVTQVVNLRTDSHVKRAGMSILRLLKMRYFLSMYLTGTKSAAHWLHSNGHVTEELRSAYEKATDEAMAKTTWPGAAPAIDPAEAAAISAKVADFRVSPLLGNDLEKLGLPPTYILAAEYDPLFDDSILYGMRLQKTGVRVDLKRFDTYHNALLVPMDGQAMREHMVDVIIHQL